jgi:D-glycero-alpha-D-manno-heptose-7-phosphate kinase
MKEIIRARAPLRLGLAGGGTDVSPFSESFGGHVLNATIDLYAQVILEPTANGKIVMMATDKNEVAEFDSSPSLPDEPLLRLYRGIYNRIINDYTDRRPLSFKITTYADAPPGSGLGTSSTMVVCIIQAFNEWLRLGLGNYEIANLAYQIERVDLGFTGGKQDQYAATFGGFNFIDFGPGESVLVNPLRVDQRIVNELEASTVLFYTGHSRESASIIQHQIINSEDKSSESYAALLLLKNDAQLMKSAILRGNLREYSEILGKSWESKKRLSKMVTNTQLDSIYNAALAAGATAGKLSGAGGGGFFMFYTAPQSRMDVIRGLAQFPGQVINFNFEMNGAESWRILDK